ncbi:helix-turn-helix DNA binding domain protein [Streptomyces phage Success]|uniref:Helix-turn-helix DNA binding domain protein n=1 Tax=Streptomyces phage Success TaxID=2999013 RepID=A0A9E8S1P7_9CAUD|nr:helix-turn-helix DNA binding domain protein [Streptomyces phage Success]WAB08825.1 helix-turn-helix DNA binding domain protein [Streptomyces phage Success]
MRPRILPSDVELLKLEAAGFSHQAIADQYGVKRQAVTKAFNLMDKYKRQAYKDVTNVLPWDLANHPDKDALKNSESFTGLRAWVRQRMGGDVSSRSELALRTFRNHLEAGEVLSLDPVQGVCWVKRDPERETILSSSGGPRACRRTSGRPCSATAQLRADLRGKLQPSNICTSSRPEQV